MKKDKDKSKDKPTPTSQDEILEFLSQDHSTHNKTICEKDSLSKWLLSDRDSLSQELATRKRLDALEEKRLSEIERLRIVRHNKKNKKKIVHKVNKSKWNSWEKARDNLLKDTLYND